MTTHFLQRWQIERIIWHDAGSSPPAAVIAGGVDWSGRLPRDAWEDIESAPPDAIGIIERFNECGLRISDGADVTTLHWDDGQAVFYDNAGLMGNIDDLAPDLPEIQAVLAWQERQAATSEERRTE